MYLSQFLICFFTTIQISLNGAVNSYVLLAGYLDDFRTIAKKFVSTDVADQIVDSLASERSIKYINAPKGKESLEYEDSQENKAHYQSDEAPVEPYKRPPPILRTQVRHANKRSAALLTLDEIVEKVKDRLQNDFLYNKRPDKQNIARVTKDTFNEKFAVIDQLKEAEPMYEESEDEEFLTTPLKPSPPNRLSQYQDVMRQKENLAMQNKRIVDRNKKLLQQKYVHKLAAQGDIYDTPKYGQMEEFPAINQKPKTQQIIRKPKQVKQPVNRLKKTDIVGEKHENLDGIFEGKEIGKPDDSYDDYVTPAKEEDVFDSYENVEQTTFSPGIVTVKYNKENRVPTVPTEIVQIANEEKDAEAPPLDEEEPLYEDDIEKTPEVELKAKTGKFSESRSLEDTVATPAKLDIRGTTKYVNTKKTTQKLGTQIPKRDFFKLSSPNYYGKLPTVAEKYNFNEPIPEQDREPENLKSIPLPPSSINGKVVLT